MASLVMWPTAIELATTWEKSEAYRYAWLVIPMFVYLVGWHYREEILANSPKPDVTGVFVALLGAFCWGVAAATNIDVGRQIALVLVIQGIAMSALGWSLYWRLFPIMGLLFLMIPSGDVLLAPLRLLTVKMIGAFANVAGLPHRIEGFSIQIGENSYVVIDACAGLSHVTLTLFLAYCFGLLIFRSVYKIALLTLFGVFLGILSNVLRVDAIVWIDWVNGSQMDLAKHSTVQWVALSLVLALLFYSLTQLKADTPPKQLVTTVPIQPSRLGPYSPVVAGLVTLIVTGAVTLLLKEESRSLRTESNSQLPEKMLGWELVPPIASWVSDTQSGLDTLSGTYRRNGRDLHVTVIETVSPGAKLHESQLAPHDHESWHDVRTEKQRSCIAEKCFSFCDITWETGQQPVIRHVYYTYNLGDFNTDSKLTLRFAHGWSRLSGRSANPRLIGFSIDGATLQPDELAAALLAIEAAL